MNDNNTNIPEKYREFFKNALSLKGRVATVVYEKELTVKKKFINHVNGIKKKSVFQIRPGVDYENIKVVKEKHESGERQRVGLPPSMKKIDVGIYHNTVKDDWYLGCAAVQNKFSSRKHEFILRDREIELEDVVCEIDGKEYTLQNVLYSSDIKSTPTEWYNLNVKNIKNLKPFKNYESI